jgi:hypothetical protein
MTPTPSNRFSSLIWVAAWSPALQAREDTPLPPFGVSRGIPVQITASVFDIMKMVILAYKYLFYG